MEARVPRDQNVTPLDGSRLSSITIHGDLDRTLALFQNSPSITHAEQESRFWYENPALLLVLFVEQLVILTFDEGLDSGPDRFQRIYQHPLGELWHVDKGKESEGNPRVLGRVGKETEMVLLFPLEYGTVDAKGVEKNDDFVVEKAVGIRLWLSVSRGGEFMPRAPHL
jgi:hypothetical protein